MQNNVGMIKPELTELPQISDRMSFIYLEQMVHDIKYLLSDSENEENKEEENAVYLWDNIKDRVENGKQYRDDGVEDGSDNDE